MNKIDELYEQRKQLQKQIHALDSKIEEETKANEKRMYKNRCKQYKQSFIKDIEIFNSKEDIAREIKFGIELRTPHYIIYFSQTDNSWKAEITDLHKSKFVVSVSLYKEEIKTVKQALNDIGDIIVQYEFENDFNGVG